MATLKNGGSNWTLVEMWKNLDTLNKQDGGSFEEALEKLQKRVALELDLDWTDTLAGRLERLYRQVLDLVHMHKRRRRRCFIDTGGKMKRFLAIASEKSPRLLERPESPQESETNRFAVHMTPQRLAEHYAQIAGAQESYVYRYRGIVADKRNQILRDIGVDPETPWTVELVLTKLEQHFKQRCQDEVDEIGSDHGSAYDIGGRRVDMATTTTALVAAALNHIEKAQEAMDEYRAIKRSTPPNSTKRSHSIKHSSASMASSMNTSKRSSTASSSLSLQLENINNIPANDVPDTPQSDGIRPRRLLDGQHPLERALIQPFVNKGEDAKSHRADTPSEGDSNLPEPEHPIPILPTIQMEGADSEARLEDTLVARLERLWFILQMPMDEKIEVVIKYTSETNADGFEDALDIWEMAAAAVLHRESTLGELVAVRRSLSKDSKAEINISRLEEVARQFLHASERVHEMKRKLEEIGDKLKVGGELYPGPGEIQSEHVEQFILWVKDGCGDK
ncbi:hypothetical protein BSKO_01159 [Bryopsis sp. KO-2023]|nr:hypothetical protein BSKO_01159 [Bryopsis sp. KO-2023]